MDLTSSINPSSAGGISSLLLRCTSCDKKATLVQLTGEDVQRMHAPLISMVCVECREKYRAAARLEIHYSSGLALLELGILTIAIFSLMILLSYALRSLQLSLPLGLSEIMFFITAVVFLTGVKMAFAEVAGRYGLTRNLRWSLRSREVIAGFSLVVSSSFVAFLLG